MTSAKAILSLQPEDGRWNHWLLVAAGVLFCLSLGFAVAASQRTRLLSFTGGPEVSLQGSTEAARLPSGAAANAAGPPAQPGFVPASRSALLVTAPATNPLNWADLELLVRTGYTDEEVLKTIAGKQLVNVVDTAQQQRLHQLGAGDALLNYLSRQPVYRTPAVPMAPPVVVVTARAVAPVRNLGQPVQAGSISPPDYAQKDRQIQNLKSQIDVLDEEIRCIRTNPDQNQYSWHYRYHDQPSRDAYLDRLDRQRNDLRRQKWQLEGR